MYCFFWRKLRTIMKMTRLAACLLLSLSLHLYAETKPESKSIRESMEAFVEEGLISGAVTLFSHAGKVVSEEAVGLRDIESKSPMTKDSLFWIASMTKPMTSLAVMMLQDDDGAMCGIVLMSSFQKELCRRWGECLVLDWTHATNNKGYYLGELMARGPHGKGISVCEMLIINQQKETMRACLKFFKSVMGSMAPETFVIDKDFTEWAVLEEEFPDTKVHCTTVLRFTLRDIAHSPLR